MTDYEHQLKNRKVYTTIAIAVVGVFAGLFLYAYLETVTSLQAGLTIGTYTISYALMAALAIFIIIIAFSYRHAKLQLFAIVALASIIGKAIADWAQTNILNTTPLPEPEP